uniref:Uncharacterized protein n=1 Tax=Anguilla anguilla TaxID=7936 RepID=A0A0E9QIZ0_ANGAN
MYLHCHKDSRHASFWQNSFGIGPFHTDLSCSCSVIFFLLYGNIVTKPTIVGDVLSKRRYHNFF